MAEKKASFSSLWQRQGQGNCWTGVQMRSLEVETCAEEEEGASRKVVFPAVWPDRASYGLEKLSNAQAGTVRLQAESAWWLNLMAPPSEPDFAALGDGFVGLLLLRQMSPSVSLWKRDLFSPPSFVFRLSAFVEERIFQASHFLACLEMAAKGLEKALEGRSRLSAPLFPLFEEETSSLFASPVAEKESFSAEGEKSEGTDLSASLEASFQLTDLDSALAELGFEYDSEEGRCAAKGIVVLARLAACAAEKDIEGFEALENAVPFEAPPEMRHAAFEFCTRMKPYLKDSMKEKAAKPSSSPKIKFQVGFSAPNAVEELLGVESCGLAPVFSPLDELGNVRRSFSLRLAKRAESPEKALAEIVAGEKNYDMPSHEAHLKMREAVLEMGAILPPVPNFDLCTVQASLARGVRRPVPARKKGISERILLDGRDLFYRMGEFEDGTPADLELHMVRESPLAKGLMECFGQAVSLGLQYGVPLEAYVEQFKYTHFPPFGEVEGGRHIRQATSLLDYVFRALAELYLGKSLPDHIPAEGAAPFSRRRGKSAESLALPFKEDGRTGTEG